MTQSAKSKKVAAPAQPAPVVPPHLRGIDGLRALAVALVVLFHVLPGALPGGGLGVDIFFVISGFLITGLLIDERTAKARIRFSAFWARRARRLLPALVLLLLVCTSAALVIGGDVLVGIGRQVLGAATFSSNWLAIANGSSYFAGTTPELFRNLWSLAVEEQFYLVWPFVVLPVLFVRWRWVRFAIFVLLAAGSATAMFLLYSPHVDPTREYYGTDTHSFGLALGAALAVAVAGMRSHPLEWPRWSRRLLQSVGAVAVVALVAISVLVPTDDPLSFRGGLALVALLSALAILGAIVPGSLLGSVLDVLPVRWVGVRSYGIYLWHWPVLILVVAAAPAWQDSPSTQWLIGTVTIAITLAVATLSYQFLERPIRRLGFRPWAKRMWQAGSRRALRISAAAILALAIVAGSGATALAIVRAPAAGSAQADIKAGQVLLAKAKYLPPPPVGAPGSNLDAVGDSVMLASAPELRQVYPGMNIDAVVSRQMNSLPGIVGALKDAGQLRPVLVVGLGTNGPIARATLDQVRDMLGPNRQMVVVNVEEPRSWEAEVNDTLAQFAADYENVELSDWYTAISPHISILARDQIHPGPTGGRIYTAALQQALARLAALPPYPQVSDFFANQTAVPTQK
ncbi:MAG TPA: acyltransferase family protein [Galbitalea sp.]|jgi:peptidoglycan/LPS O-acetylase OafA/YrhL